MNPKELPPLPSIEMPARIARLRRLGQYPVPFFVADVNGMPDFRIIRPEAIAECHNYKLCWICGQPRGAFMSFVVGPMCAINKISSEPPSHTECAVYAARVCPFLANPSRARREENKPAHEEMPGIGIKRNPGVTLVWTTKSYRVFQVQGGVLFKIGEPTERQWFARGREATKDEIMESVRTGLPQLAEAAKLDGPEAQDALAQLVKEFEASL
jgi:hypothetical protein